MKSIFFVASLFITLFFLTVSSSIAIVKCVRPDDGDVVYRNDTCPPGYIIERDYSPENKNTRKQRVVPKEKKSKNNYVHEQKMSSHNTNTTRKEDIDKLTSYAVILGRACGCGIDVSDASRRVSAWLDRTFPPDSPDRTFYMKLFISGMQYHAKQQSTGNSPDTCEQIKKALNGMQWP